MADFTRDAVFHYTSVISDHSKKIHDLVDAVNKLSAAQKQTAEALQSLTLLVGRLQDNMLTNGSD